VSMEAVSARWGNEPEPEREAIALHDLTVVIPARNAEHLLEGCLGGIRRAGPAEYIVVDGQSGDETARLARALGARVLSDEGRGLPAARALGAAAARTRYVALVDADVVMPDGALAALLEEFISGGYTALLDVVSRRTREIDWRAFFFIGIVLGALAFALIAGGPDFHGYGWLTTTFTGDSRFLVAPILVVAGVLIGFGAKVAGGCTSGNGLSGTSMGSLASLVATVTFFATAIAVSFLIEAVI